MTPTASPKRTASPARKSTTVASADRRESDTLSRQVLGDDVLLSTADLAAMIRKPVSWVWNQPVERLPARVKLGARTVFYRASDVRQWIDANRVGGARP